MNLKFHRLRVWLRARRALAFAPGTAANRIRGLLGNALRKSSCLPDCSAPELCPHGRTCLYGQVFAPSAGSGPSGLRNRPRPFTLRPPEFDGRLILPGAAFAADLHLFDLRPHTAAAVVEALVLVADSIGGRPGGAELVRAETLELDGRVCAAVFDKRQWRPSPPVAVPLDAPVQPVSRLRVEFLTPVELKGGDFTATNPVFAVLLSRARDRVANLIRFYGEEQDAAGLAGIDFSALGARARDVACVDARLEPVSAWRTSRGTGRTHGLGGLVGEAAYAGALGEFLPWLEAAQWTGVGRQTVWGKGVLRVHAEAGTQDG